MSPIQLARSLEEYESRLDEKIRQFFSDSLSDFAKLQWSMEDDSPTVIMISPKDPLPGQLVSQLSSIGVVSPYVGKKMGELAVGEYISGAKRLYDTLYTLPNCQESAGYLFKARCHLCFTAGRYHFTPRILQPPSPRNPMSTIFNMKMDVPPQLSRNFKNIDDLTSILRGKPASAKYYHLTTNVYSQPYRSNLPAIDAIMIYRPSPHSQPRVVMLHYTLSYNHPLSGAGIQDVLNALPQELRKASQIKGNEPILLFAVPEEKKDHFQYQTTTNSNNELDNIIQMVVGMRSSTLWGGAVMNLFHTSRAILSSSPYLSRSGLRIVSGSSQLPSMCGRPNTMDVTALHLDLF